METKVLRLRRCSFCQGDRESNFGASTQRPQSSSFLGLPYRILNMNPQKELLWGLWVV